MKKDTLLIDTNVIIRFLANDDEEQSDTAYEVFKKAVNEEITLVLTPMVIAECTWVLGMKRYGYSKEHIADSLARIIAAPGVRTMEEDVVLAALHNYNNCNIDFVDAYLAATSLKIGNPCLTWNSKDFKRCEDVEHYTPDEIV